MADITLQVTANAQKAINSLNQMNNAIQRLGKSLNSLNTSKLQSGFSKINSTVGTANSNMSKMGATLGKVKSSSGGVSTGLSNIANGMKKMRITTNGLATAIGKFYVKYFLLIRAIKGIWSSVKSASNIVETYNYLNKSFTQIGKDSVDQWKEYGYESAEAYVNSFTTRATELTKTMTGYQVDSTGNMKSTTGKSLGMSPTDLMNYQSQFAQMANSMGVSSENAMKLSESLSKIGGDLASTKNKDFTVVWDNMSSGLVGMSRAVDKYGTNIRVSALNEELANMGIDTTVAKLDAEDKALLRTIVILKSSQYAWGDLSDTFGTSANQMRYLKTNLTNLGNTIGGIFLAGFQRVIPYINAMVMALQRLAQWITATLGIKLPSVASSSTSNISDLQDEIYGTDDALDSASSSAEKLKKNLLGIDELNVLSDDDGSGGGSGTSSTYNGDEIQAEFDKIYEEYMNAWDKAYSNLDTKAQDIADRIVKAFKKGDYESIGKYISTSIANSLDGIDWEETYQKARKTGSNIASFLNGFFDEKAFSTFGTSIAGYFNTIGNTIYGFVTTLNWKKIGNALGTGINSFVKEIDTALIAKNLHKAICGALEMVTTLLKKVDFVEVGKKIGQFLTNLDIGEILIRVSELALEVVKATIKTTYGIVEEIDNAIFSNDIEFEMAGIEADLDLKTEDFNEYINGLDYISQQVGYNTTSVFGSLLNFDTTAYEQVFDVLEEVQKSYNGTLSDTQQFTSWLNDEFKNLDGTTYDYLMTLSMQADNLDATTAYWLKYHYGLTTVEGAYDSLTDAEKGAIESATSLSEIYDGTTKTVEDVTNAIKASISADERKTNAINATKNAISQYIKEQSGSYTNAIVQETNAEQLKTNAINASKNAYQQYAEEQRKATEEAKNTTTETQSLATSLDEMGITADELSDYIDVLSTTDLPDLSTKVQEVSEIIETAFPGAVAEVKNGISDMRVNFVGLYNYFNNVFLSGFSESKISNALSGVAPAFETVFNNVGKIIQNTFNKLADAINEVMSVSWDAVVVNGKEVASAGSAQLMTISHIDAFANGGYPTPGELFLANENGAEMVGSIGNRTAVVNNDQIVSAVSQGVSVAVSEAMIPYLSRIANSTESTANKDFSVSIGDREIARANIRGQRSMGRSIISTV